MNPIEIITKYVFLQILYNIGWASNVNKSIVSLIIILALLLSFSCKDASTIILPFSSRVEYFKNVPWIVARVDMGDSTLNQNDYEPFHFIIGDNIIFGDDGCNSYNGKFVLDNHILSVSAIGHTEMACFREKPLLNVCQLVRRWRLDIVDTTLMLRSGDTTFIFSSEWTRPVQEYTFTDKQWRLSSSNDTAFNFLRSVDLLPTLSISKGRKFQLNWYFAPQNPIFPSNSIQGVFGIGNGQSICFYQTGGAYASPQDPPVGARDVFFVNRISNATRFTYSNTMFVLYSPSGGVYYGFTLER
jgi:heat shock protein HslJ